MARPQKEANLTEEQIENLAAFGCTDEEIAVLAGLSERTVQRSFDTLLKKGRAGLRLNLRSAQVKKALGVYVPDYDKQGNRVDLYLSPPDNTMLIWLGKQYLGQSDKAETKDTSDPIDWDTVPDDVRAAFIAGKVTLSDVRRSISRRTN
jgi:DNA-binding CsgD family transcriptional regulator